MIRARNDRLEACTGPTQKLRIRAQTQNTAASALKRIGSPPMMMITRPAMMTGLGPSRSSNQPAIIAPAPAETLAATPRTMISEGEKP